MTEPPSVVFFLGAGFSAPAGVPTTIKFVRDFRQSLSSQPTLSEPLTKLVNQLEMWCAFDHTGERQADVELLLEALTFASNQDKEVATALYDQISKPILDRQTAVLLADELKTFIRSKSLVGIEATTYLVPLRSFVERWSTSHFFTVNYDIALEQFLERFRYTYTDGFELEWKPGLLSSTDFRAFVYKLHGSAIWFRSANGKYLKLPIRGASQEIELLTGEPAVPLMLYPAQKLVYSGPFLSLLGELEEKLTRCEWVVVIGYSFRDAVFLRAFWEAAVRNPKLRMILVSPEAGSIYERKLSILPEERASHPPDNAATPIPSPLAGRVVALPFRVEDILQDLMTSAFDRLSQANYEETRALKAEVDYKPTKWMEVALTTLNAFSYHRLHFLEQKFRLSEVAPETRLEYLGKKALLAAALGARETKDDPWRSVIQVFEHWGTGGLVLHDANIPKSVTPYFGVVGGDPRELPLNTTQLTSPLLNICAYGRDLLRFLGQEPDPRKVLVTSRSMPFEALRKYTNEFPGDGKPTEKYLGFRGLSPKDTQTLGKFLVQGNLGHGEKEEFSGIVLGAERKVVKAFLQMNDSQ